MELSQEQKIAYDTYCQGKNLFITGPGGSGKSLLIQKIYKHAIANGKDIHVTALTGCAAVLLNCKAKTLHSWAGIGLGNAPLENIVKKIRSSRFSKNLWKTTDILIVDEVSMLSEKLFELLNALGKILRQNERPLGGIQVIFSGDFYQLPPVGNKDEIETMRFCFESKEWNEVFLLENQIELVKIFRQTDSVYSSMLNQIREGVIKKKTNEFLLGYVGREMDKKWVTSHPTQLFPTRNKVETINNNKMASLTGDAKLFTLERRTDCEMSKSDAYLRDSFTEKDIAYELDSLAGNIICDAVLYLKKGAQVMSVVNIQNDKGLEICNGSQGIVIGFCEVSGLPRVKFNNGIEMTMARHTWISEKIPGIGVSQVPLILAWALTIHKSQGATLDMAEIDVGSGIFECGQTYVALSRVKSLEGLYLTSFDAKRIRINKKVKEYYQQLREYRLKNPWDLSLITETEFLDKKGYKEQCVTAKAVLELVPELVPELVYENASLFSEYNYVEAELISEL